MERLTFTFIWIFILLTLIGFVDVVSAQDSIISTCLETNGGSYCQQFSSEQECDEACSEGCIPTPRTEIASCELGTCYDTSTGLCQWRSTKSSCESGGGEYSKDIPEEIENCVRGICIVGASTSYTTRGACEKRGELLGASAQFTIGDEFDYLETAQSLSEGACIKETESGNTCRFVIGSDCNLPGEKFYEGALCSNEELETVCESQATTGCVLGEEDVYWFDSCGNRENVYMGSSSSDKEDSFNEGFILTDEESLCSLTRGTNNFGNQGNCGNCDGITSACGKKTSDEKLADSEQEYVCRDISCIDENGNEREHGESWCVFQSSTGIDLGADNLGRAVDPPGSNHFREVCWKGDVRRELCEPGRGEVCTEVRYDDKSTAICRDNEALDCVEITGKYLDDEISKKEMLKDCEENIDCFVKNTSVPLESYCVPKVPLGSDELCSLGNQECTSIWRKGWSFRYKCIENCFCHNPIFAEQANDLCMSLGDCGASVNYAGDFSDDYEVGGWYGIPPSDDYLEGLKDYNIPAETIFIELSDAEIFDYIGRVLHLPTNIDLQIAIHNNWFGLRDDMEQDDALGQLHASFAFGGSLGGGVIAKLVGKLVGVGKTKGHTAHFNCLPWEPPAGGDKCNQCGEEGFDCTEYSCKTLGKNCELINEGTSDETCENTGDRNDILAPIISPWLDNITEGHSYAAISERGFEVKNSEGDGCIEEFALVDFGISLNELGKCKISYESFSEFDNEYDLDFDSSESSPDYDILSFGRHVYNHSIRTMVPNLEAIGVNDVGPTARGTYKMFVTCEDASPNENVNEFDYVIEMCVKEGVDLVPPIIQKIVPDSENIRFDAKVQDVTIYLNEPAECKWDDKNVEFSEMENDFNCKSEPQQRTLFGWKCDDTFSIKNDESKFYVSCIDQPWEEDETKRNIMDPKEIRFMKTDELEIEKVSPDGDYLVFGGRPGIVNLSVETDGGINNGEATCYYKWGERWIEMISSSSLHWQRGLKLFEGGYDIPIKCIDPISNIAYGNITFNISIDSTPPELTRIYVSSGDLVIVTDEPSSCYYSKTDCFFDIKNQSQSTKMSGDDIVHTTGSDSSITYYIRCADKFGREHYECKEVKIVV